MTTHQLLVFGKSYIAFHNAGAHFGGGFVGLFGVFGKLHGRAAVANGKQRFMERAFAAALQFFLERALVHVVHQVERTWTELYRGFVFVDDAWQVIHMGQSRKGQRGKKGQGKTQAQTEMTQVSWKHETILLKWGGKTRRRLGNLCDASLPVLWNLYEKMG